MQGNASEVKKKDRKLSKHKYTDHEMKNELRLYPFLVNVTVFHPQNSGFVIQTL